MTITVVIPTITGREDHLARCVAAYETRSSSTVKLVILHDKPTCAEGWNEGAGQATGDFLHFSADDLEPHEGWDLAAVEAVAAGKMPAPRILNPAGGIDYCGVHRVDMPDWATVQMSVIPFMRTEWWERIGPVPPIHYFSDNYVSHRAALAGWPTVVRRGYEFTHHWAQEGRGAGMTEPERMEHDWAAFSAAIHSGKASAFQVKPT